MARSFQISAAAAAAMLGDGATLGLGAYMAGGRLLVYDGAKPASCADPVTTQRLLAAFDLASPAFATASDNVLTALPVTSTTAALSGSASWFRATSALGGTACQGTAGLAGENCDCTLDNKLLTVGALVAVTEWVITQYLG